MTKYLLLLLLLSILKINLCQNPYIQGGKTFCSGEQIELWAYGDTSFAWANINMPDSILSTSNHFIDYPKSTPSYYLYSSVDTTLIVFSDARSACYCQYYIPNFFSPDGDEYNDKFTPTVSCEHFAMRLTIYSREQLIVFDETNYNVSWDGRNQATGEKLQNGVYPYLFSFITERGDKVTLEGFVLLGL